MNNILIALHALPGGGKDTIANRLIEDGGWGKFAFATPLKRGLSAMLDIPMEDIENPSLKNEPDYKFGRSIRYMMQTLGTEWGRGMVSDSLWVDLARANIEHQFAMGMNVVNTDLRFPNECELIKEMGGTVIHIIRANNINASKAARTGMTSHSSDSSIPVDIIDYVLYNDSSLDNLYKAALQIITEVMNKHGVKE